MLRRCVCLLWAVCLASVMGTQVKAAEQTGSVQVIPTWCGKPISGGTVSLSRVGEKVLEGYQLTDGLANWIVEEGDELSETWLNWLLQGTEESVTSGPVQDQVGAVFCGLEEGVYLVRQLEAAPDYAAFEPFLLSVPEGNAWDIIREPKIQYVGESPKTGDHPAPIIGAMGLGFSVAVLMVLADQHKK